MEEKFVIIDGNSLINRAFYALPLLSNSKGEYSNGVYGFVNILIKAIFEIKPKYIAVALDYGKKTFRNNLFPEYKAKRRPTPNELISQFPILRKFLDTMQIKYIELEGYEADDIIGTLSHSFNTKNIIVTGDRDALQLINDNTEVWLTKKGITEVKNMNSISFKEEYGIDVSKFIDLKALMGDASDNIPGVLGVGEKTGLELIKTYGSLDGVYENTDKLKGKMQEKIVLGKSSAYLSRELSTIKTDIALNVKLDDFLYPFPFSEEVYKLFDEYDFNSLTKRDDIFIGKVETKSKQPKFVANEIEIKDYETLDKQIGHIKKSGFFNFEITNTALSFAYDKNCEYYVEMNDTLLRAPFTFDGALGKLKEIFEDEKIEKIVYDKKTLMHHLDNLNINLKGVKFDVILAYYLLIAGEKEATKKNLFNDYDINEKLQGVSLFYLYDILKKELIDNKLDDLYNKIEFPLTDVLFEMEKTGFKIDKNTLSDLRNKYTSELESLATTIHTLAGREFNVNSPKQVGEVLYNDLKLISYNNKKKSTSIDRLEELYDLHPIISYIIRYRKIKKIVSTYIEPYEEMLSGDENIIHTLFNQTLTATGRLSSSEPNLQNIPVREEEGRNLRKIFITRHKEGALVSADYSQIELRLLAHYSNDESLINAFHNGIDIHSLTASEIFGVPIQDVDAGMRRTAKAVNFGIIYGISDFGLAQNIGCTRKQAKEYIERYFKRYSKIKAYLDSCIESAKNTGYARTLFNRRRKINELASSKYITKNFGERVAMNTPLQGSASDIIKLAMVNVHKALIEKNMKSKLILQIHDELIIDATNDEITLVARLLKENMENVVKLSVPLTVDVSSGKTWFDC